MTPGRKGRAQTTSPTIRALRRHVAEKVEPRWCPSETATFADGT